MTYIPQHGRRHEIEFYAEPSGNEMLNGIAEVLVGPGATWDGTHGIAYRCLHISPDKRTYIIEEIDIWQSLLEKNPKKTKWSKVVEVVLTCETCATVYHIWRIVADDGQSGWTGNKHWLHTAHCPACPPMSTDVWLAGLGYYQERPTLTPLDSTGPRHYVPSPEIDMADFD